MMRREGAATVIKSYNGKYEKEEGRKREIGISRCFEPYVYTFFSRQLSWILPIKRQPHEYN